MGGALPADNRTFSKEEIDNYFFVHLNHHLFRREDVQPCDWLIARQGSTMIAENFLKLKSKTRERIKIISPQINEFEKYAEWRDLCTTSEKIIFPFHEAGFINMNPYHPSVEWCNQFWNEIGTNPFMGILAIRMILLFPIRSLKLYGFDFFKEGEDFRKNIGCHNIRVQILWLLHLYNTDFRVEADQRLLNVFSKFGKIQRGIKEIWNANN